MPPKKKNTKRSWDKFPSLSAADKNNFLVEVQEMEEPARPTLTEAGAEALMAHITKESAKESMTYIKVRGREKDEGFGTFRLSTNVLYEYSLPELEEGQSDPSKTCILRLEKKNGALSDTLHQIYTNQMECFQRQICSESLSFTQCKNLDSFFKTLASLFTDCKDFDLKVDMSRQILKTTLLLDVFKDWVSDDAAKTKPLSLQFQALECVHLMFQEKEGRMMILEKDMAVGRLTAILDLAAAARSGAISERCIKILTKLGQTVNHGFQVVNKQNPVLEAIFAWFSSSDTEHNDKATDLDSLHEKMAKLFQRADADHMLDLNNFSDDQEDLRGITKPLIKYGKNGKLNSIDVTAFQLSDALDAQRWRLKGNMQVTAESLSMPIYESDDATEGASIIHVPLDLIQTLEEPEDPLQPWKVTLESAVACPDFDAPMDKMFLAFAEPTGPESFSKLVPNLDGEPHYLASPSDEKTTSAQVPEPQLSQQSRADSIAANHCDVNMMDAAGNDVPVANHLHKAINKHKSFYAGTSQASETAMSPIAKLVQKPSAQKENEENIEMEFDDDMMQAMDDFEKAQAMIKQEEDEENQRAEEEKRQKEKEQEKQEEKKRKAAEKDQKKKQKAEEQQRLRAEEKKSADKEAKKKGAKGNADVGESSSSVQATQTSEKRASGRLTRSSATRPAASVVVNKTAEAKSKANNKAKKDDPESEEVGSQALPSLMASKVKASKGDAGFDDFDDDGEEEKMKKRKKSDEKTTTADSQKMPKLDKASAEDKGRPQRLSIAKVKEIEEQGEIGKTRMGNWAREAAKEAYEQKQKGKRGSKLPPAPLKPAPNKKNHASNDGKKEETNGQDVKKMATESRPLPKPLSKKSCSKKLEMERKASERDKDDAMKEEDPKSKTEEGVEGAAGKADPWADDYQLEETNQSPEEKRNGMEQQRVTRQSAAKDGSKRQSDGAAKALDASTISGLTTVDRDKANSGLEDESAKDASAEVDGKQSYQQVLCDYPGAMDDAVHTLDGEDAASYHEDEETFHVLPRHLDFKDVKGGIENEKVGARAEKGGLSLDDDSLSLDGDSQQSLSPSSFDGPRQGRGAPQGRFQQVTSQLKALLKSVHKQKKDCIKRHADEQRAKIAAEIQDFKESQAKIMAEKDKEYEKKVADLCARYKDAEIRRLGAYTAVKEVAQRLYKRRKDLIQKHSSLQARVGARMKEYKEVMIEARRVCQNSCSNHIQEFEKTVQKSERANKGNVQEIQKLLGQLFED